MISNHIKIQLLGNKINKIKVIAMYSQQATVIVIIKIIKLLIIHLIHGQYFQMHSEGQSMSYLHQ